MTDKFEYKYTGKEIKEQLIKNAEFAEEMVQGYLDYYKVKTVYEMSRCLIDKEKQDSTFGYYSLSMNSVVEACHKNINYGRNCREKAVRLNIEDEETVLLTEQESLALGLLRHHT